MQHFTCKLRPKAKGFHLVTNEVLGHLPPLPENGLLHVFIQHTSAGLTLGENADRTVRSDMAKAFDLLAPENQDFYEHTLEGPDDMPAHIKSALLGASVSIPIIKGRPAFGNWQGIYLGEFREAAGPRTLILTLLS
jgi:secondary thiamine-phosphate synthase enzyme